jgi:hypothetical protein
LYYKRTNNKSKMVLCQVHFNGKSCRIKEERR